MGLVEKHTKSSYINHITVFEMFSSIEEGLIEAEKYGKRTEVLSRAKEIQVSKRPPISLLDSIEYAFQELVNKAPKK